MRAPTANHRRSVLVVDDDPDFREFVLLALQDWGMTGIEAGDCEAALAALDEPCARAAGDPRSACDQVASSVGVVLLDYFMPGPSPCTCVERLRVRLGAEVHIVLVSAAVDINERAEELGLDQCLAKPFEMADLRAAVTRAAQPSVS